MLKLCLAKRVATVIVCLVNESYSEILLEYDQHTTARQALQTIREQSSSVIVADEEIVDEYGLYFPQEFLFLEEDRLLRSYELSSSDRFEFRRYDSVVIPERGRKVSCKMS